MDPQVAWEPASLPQRALLASPTYEVLFGGARGGGKTDGVLGEWAQHASQYGPHAVGLMVRRTGTQLGETFERARQIFGPLGATMYAQPMRIKMPNGARLNFAHLERDHDAENYQGHSYTRIYIEEAGNFPSPAPILKLQAALRSGHGVKCRMRLTGNPGGPGHQWIKARYIDPAPLGWKVIADPDTGLERVFIPSRVTDNPFLGADYVAQLRQSGSPELVRAWLEGDWSVVAGAFFPEFSIERHVIPVRTLPRYWARFRAFDWGSARPFCCLWFAVSDGELAEFPRGALIVYREWYGSTGAPNVGLRMTAEEIADGILRREAADVRHGTVMTGVADPAIFAEDGGPSYAQRMAMAKCFWRPADNKRVAQIGAMGGWDQVRARLKGDGEKPALFIFETCCDLIRTLPAVQHDEGRPEDLDTEGEDHACFAAGTIVNGSPVERIGSLTRCATQVILLTFDDGLSVVCTPDHRFLCEDGSWKQAKYMSGSRLFSATRLKSLRASSITAAAFTSSARAADYIASFGNATTALFRRAITFTTSMRTAPTTGFPIFASFLVPSTCPSTGGTASRHPPRLTLLPRNGIAALEGAGGTLRMPSAPGKQKRKSMWTALAKFAGECSRRSLSSRIAQSSATRIAEPARCVRVDLLSERRDVYCLATNEGWLTLANGVIASNCDTLRYGCMSRPYTIDAPDYGREPDRYRRQRAASRKSAWAA